MTFEFASGDLPAHLLRNRQAVYDAQEEARLILEADLGLLSEPVDGDRLYEFCVGAMVGAGWSEPSPGELVLALDVPDDSIWAGGLDPVDHRVVHLHPRLLNPMIVLHELAHWLGPMDGHGPRFCDRLLDLVGAAGGPMCRDVLEDCFAMSGVAWG